MTKGDALLKEFAAFLKRSGFSVMRGTTVKAISAAERRLQVSIPHSLVRVLEACGGTDANEVLDRGATRHIRFWGVQELRVADRPEVGPWAPALLFADYMIHSVEFGLSLRHESVVVAAGNDSIQVANSLEQFIAAYMRDDPSILGPVLDPSKDPWPKTS